MNGRMESAALAIVSHSRGCPSRLHGLQGALPPKLISGEIRVKDGEELTGRRRGREGLRASCR